MAGQGGRIVFILLRLIAKRSSAYSNELALLPHADYDFQAALIEAREDLGSQFLIDIV